jgi:HAD superfamily hydrolase (TIGR01549 family)
MKPSIKAICFDVGGTLRVSHEKPDQRQENVNKIKSIINDDRETLFWIEELSKREHQYRVWSRRTLLELTEAEIWHRFMLPEISKEIIYENAITLNQLWREAKPKTILPDAVDTLSELKNRGYALGIISNTTSSVEVPLLLKENGIENLFGCVILSTVYGKRKPHPALFIDCARDLKLEPEECAYVGDMISRDVVGGRQAGFSEIVIIDAKGYNQNSNELEDDDPESTEIQAMEPDFRIGRLYELLDLYPDRNQFSDQVYKNNGNPKQLYNIALSTMWHVDQKTPFNQSFLDGRKAGFPRVELNHRVDPELFKQWDRDKFYIHTVHDPCPATVSGDQIKTDDINISSLNESKRIKAVDLLKQTIDTGLILGSKSVVVHPGMIMCDYGPETILKEMYGKGLKGTVEYEELKGQMIAFRNRTASAHVEQVLKSLTEIIEYARPTGLEIGLENRLHFYDIPLIDEMQSFLDLCDEDWYGFQYDVGHAQVLAELGFVGHEEWLERFGKRIIGVHIHDVLGITDHQPPGRGNVDFTMVAPYIPQTANLTMEVNPDFSIEQLRQGLEFLVQFGIIEQI